jgi:hypothetical protein
LTLANPSAVANEPDRLFEAKLDANIGIFYSIV